MKYAFIGRNQSSHSVGSIDFSFLNDIIINVILWVAVSVFTGSTQYIKL